MGRATGLERPSQGQGRGRVKDIVRGSSRVPLIPYLPVPLLQSCLRVHPQLLSMTLTLCGTSQVLTVSIPLLQSYICSWPTCVRISQDTTIYRGSIGTGLAHTQLDTTV